VAGWPGALPKICGDEVAGEGREMDGSGREMDGSGRDCRWLRAKGGRGFVLERDTRGGSS